MSVKIAVIFLWCWMQIWSVAAEPGRDLCKIYRDGLKCSNMDSQYFPHDTYLTFNDDLAGFTYDMKFLEVKDSNISILQSRSFQRSPYLSHILLSKIFLTEIEQGAFEGLKKLKLVDLSRNLIRFIPVDTFKHTRVNRLNLEGNALLEFRENEPILNARFLTSLSLRNCTVRNLTESAFGGVPALIHLDLSQNLLESLPEKIFSPLTQLNYLDLSRNQFSHLSIGLFESIPSYPKYPIAIALHHNPWICDCKMAKLSNWVTKNWRTGIWSEIPSETRLRKPVTCKEPVDLSWNSAKFKESMDSC